ncbi:MAG: tetratricopeptide repeat protein [Gemmatimonadaceae bacterium]|nr:tetratricopeptide repeat protein [Gemmatimonadaceae bacterium]
MARSTRPAWIAPLLGVLALLLVGGLAWWALAGRSSGSNALNEGITAYKEGRREAAEGAFRKAALDAPADPLPHVYMARMERERGNLQNANAEAAKAVALGPTSALALRELASVLFAQKNYELARTFYIRALKADPSDRLAQGFLGCSLIRLGRVDEGAKWISRAGTGGWSTCLPAQGGAATGMPNP